MAKHIINSVILHFAQCFSRKELNQARPSGNYGSDSEQGKLIDQFVRECWWKGPNGIVEASSVKDSWIIDGKEVPLETFVEDEMKHRETQWEFYKSQAKTDRSKAFELDVFEEGFVVNGKLRRPEYLLLTGNRRFSVFLRAMMIRAKMTKAKLFKDSGIPQGVAEADADKPLILDWDIPVRIDDFRDPERRLDLQIKENDGKTQGNLPTSEIDRLLVAKHMLELGSSQGKLRTRFGDSIGVKLYGLVVLNNMFPDVRIIQRMQIDDPKNPDFIPIKSVQFPILQSMLQRTDPESTEAYNKKQSKKDQPSMPQLSADEVREYFSDVKKGKEGGSVKMMDKNEVLDLKKASPNPFVQATADRIHNNNPGELFKKTPLFAPACRDLVTLEGDGDYGDVENLLAAIVKVPKGERRNQLLRQAIDLFNSKPATPPAPQGKTKVGAKS